MASTPIPVLRMVRPKSEQVRLRGLVDDSSFSLPAGKAITAIFIRNNNANAITGGINIGTTDGGADVVSAAAVAANALVRLQPATVLKSVFSMSVPTIIYLTDVTAWNGANIDVWFVMEKLVP